MRIHNEVTLVELLEEVAIIGVLVAISIPIFTSQLEKSREATDAANARAAYAEMMAAAASGDTDETIATNDVYTITYANKKYTATIHLKQTQPEWQGTTPSIGGVATTTKPTGAANGGTCEIVCEIADTDAETVTVNWAKS